MAAADGDIGGAVEATLLALRSEGGDDAAARGEELVRLLVDYYGDGLTRIVEVVAAANPEIVQLMAADPLVGSQLILHGLHPLSVHERVEAALDRVRPYLGSHAGGVEFVGIDEKDVAHLRLGGSCHGCPSSSITVRSTIQEAVLGAAPELVGVEVDGQVEREPPLLQIGMPKRAESAAAPIWLHPSALELPRDGAVSPVHLDGRQVLMARRGETLYAYADRCAACGESIAEATLRGDLLTCPGCKARFDIRLAGRAVDGSGRHLEPLPLLDDVSGIRVALQPEAV